MMCAHSALQVTPPVQGTLCREQGHHALFNRTGNKPTPYRAKELISDSKNPLWPSSYILHLKGRAALVAALPTKGNLSLSASFGLVTCRLYLLMKMVTKSRIQPQMTETSTWLSGLCSLPETDPGALRCLGFPSWYLP